MSLGVAVMGKPTLCELPHRYVAGQRSEAAPCLARGPLSFGVRHPDYFLAGQQQDGISSPVIGQVIVVAAGVALSAF